MINDKKLRETMVNNRRIITQADKNLSLPSMRTFLNQKELNEPLANFNTLEKIQHLSTTQVFMAMHSFMYQAFVSDNGKIWDDSSVFKEKLFSGYNHEPIMPNGLSIFDVNEPILLVFTTFMHYKIHGLKNQDQLFTLTIGENNLEKITEFLRSFLYDTLKEVNELTTDYHIYHITNLLIFHGGSILSIFTKEEYFHPLLINLYFYSDGTINKDNLSIIAGNLYYPKRKEFYGIDTKLLLDTLYDDLCNNQILFSQAIKVLFSHDSFNDLVEMIMLKNYEIGYQKTCHILKPMILKDNFYIINELEHHYLYNVYSIPTQLFKNAQLLIAIQHIYKDYSEFMTQTYRHTYPDEEYDDDVQMFKNILSQSIIRYHNMFMRHMLINYGDQEEIIPSWVAEQEAPTIPFIVNLPIEYKEKIINHYDKFFTKMKKCFPIIDFT